MAWIVKYASIREVVSRIIYTSDLCYEQVSSHHCKPANYLRVLALFSVKKARELTLRYIVYMHA